MAAIVMPAAWMLAGGIASWAAAALVVEPVASRDVALGMIAPVVSAAGTWVVLARVQQRNPAGMTPVMLGAFAVKMVLFGVYVTVMLRVVDLEPRPFIASFTIYFVSLHAIEAVMLRRLFGTALSEAR
jgi:hypothetical protein